MSSRILLIACLSTTFLLAQFGDIPFPFKITDHERLYRPLSTSAKNEAKTKILEMFYHGYDNYMNLAFPEDELGRHV